MNDTQERRAAQLVLELAGYWGMTLSANEQDHDAATAAILMHALELATPDLSAEQRARIFMEEE